jgi:hypothetical protein
MEYANSAKVISMVASRVMAARGLVTSVEPVKLEDGLAALTQAETDRSTKFEGVALLGDTATVECAYEFNQRLWQLEALAFDETQVDAEAWRDAFAAYRKTRSLFYQRARASMGVPTANIPIESWTAYPWRWAAATGPLDTGIEERSAP